MRFGVCVVRMECTTQNHSQSLNYLFLLRVRVRQSPHCAQSRPISQQPRQLCRNLVCAWMQWLASWPQPPGYHSQLAMRKAIVCHRIWLHLKSSLTVRDTKICTTHCVNEACLNQNIAPLLCAASSQALHNILTQSSQYPHTVLTAMHELKSSQHTSCNF